MLISVSSNFSKCAPEAAQLVFKYITVYKEPVILKHSDQNILKILYLHTCVLD